MTAQQAQALLELLADLYRIASEPPPVEQPTNGRVPDPELLQTP